MINMAVGHQEVVDGTDIEFWTFPVEEPQFFLPLEHTRVQEHASVADGQQMLGSGDRPRGAVKPEFHVPEHSSILK